MLQWRKEEEEEDKGDTGDKDEHEKKDEEEDEEDFEFTHLLKSHRRFRIQLRIRGDFLLKKSIDVHEHEGCTVVMKFCVFQPIIM